MRWSAETLLRYDRPGPRYTSYPTVPSWRDADASLLAEGLAKLSGLTSVYVHVPFCQEQCLYCACNMVVARAPAAGDRYLDALEAQVQALPLPAGQVPVVRVHLGGGTPTWLSVGQLDRLFDVLAARFSLAPDATISVEADPEVTTAAQLDLFAKRGVRRISYGVQDLDPVVLAAVQRPQDPTRLAALVVGARERGISRVNLDLIYGLPYQTVETLAATFDRIVDLRPDRLAVFGYAHVPWMKPHQRLLPEAALPGPLARVELFLAARERLLGEGYVQVGLDHFALPDDPLAIAKSERRLYRDFMGYTTRPGGSLIGLGPSAISELPDRYAQQESKLGPWLREAAALPVRKGMILTAEDRLRRDVIQTLLCNLDVRWDRVAARHGVDPTEALADALAALAPLEVDGLVTIDSDGLSVPEDASLLVRNVAMVFDNRLSDGRFSRTV